MADNFTDITLVFPQPKIRVISLGNGCPLYRCEAFLRDKYLEKGLSIAQIAAEIFSSKQAVSGGLKRFGIPLRRPHRPHRHPSQPRYGRKISEGQATEHKTEAKVIEAITEMRATGMGLRAIARCLSQMGIPTKCRGKKWHPEMVRRILASAPTR
jgi:hypothetical protein